MKKTNMIIGSVVVVATLFIVLMYTGILPDFLNLTFVGSSDLTVGDTTGSDEHDLGLSDYEIFSMIEVMYGNDLQYDEIQPYIHSLHMKIYGRNNMNAVTLQQLFEAQYVQAGWQSVGKTMQMSTGWVAYHETWSQTTNIRSVSIGEGAAVLQAFGYETLYLVAYGPATTYYQFYNAVTT